MNYEELFEELKVLIDEGKKEEAKAKVDELSLKVEKMENNKVDNPLPGEGTNGL